MKRRLVVPLALAVLGLALPVQASLFLGLDQTFSGEKPDGTKPWVAATFTNGPAPQSVTLTLSTAGLANQAFVSNWYFNFDDHLSVAGLKFTFDDKDSTGPAASVSLGKNQFKADGDGYYDILLSFPTPKKNRFDAGEIVQYTITSTLSQAFDEDSFAFFSTPKKGEEGSKNVWKSAAHVQGGDDSGWIGAGAGPIPPPPPPPAVPEPMSLVVWSALGALGLAARLLRKRA